MVNLSLIAWVLNFNVSKQNYNLIKITVFSGIQVDGVYKSN